MTQREQFEKWAARPPREWPLEAHAYTYESGWPGQYKAYHVQCAWEAWQARAEVTPAMIEAAAQRLVSWPCDNLVWPDSWNALDVAASRNSAERALLSGLCA